MRFNFTILDDFNNLNPKPAVKYEFQTEKVYADKTKEEAF
jgi:hypothetical protein